MRPLIGAFDRASIRSGLSTIRRGLGISRSGLPTSVNLLLDRLLFSRHVQDGLPPGLEEALIRHLVRDLRQAELVSSEYVALQSWKTGSAFQLRLTLSNGQDWPIVFKDARYGPLDFPAVDGLAMAVGIPEYEILSHPTPGLRTFIPQVLGTWELSQGEHYQYVLEDLNARYHRVYGRRDKTTLLKRLGDLHQELAEWFDVHSPQDFMTYDGDYFQQILIHAEKGLDQFSSQEATLTAEVRKAWPKIQEHLTNDKHLSRRRLRPIHGDFNTKNGFISLRNADEVKLVDWEWFGLGTVHDDMASLLKKHDPKMENTALKMAVEMERDLHPKEHLELFWWSRLATAVRDAALLSNQLAGLDKPSPVIADRAQGLWHGLIRLNSFIEDGKLL